MKPHYISAAWTNEIRVKEMDFIYFLKRMLMRISVEDLTRKIQNRPEIPPVHFPSWDYLYMRDIRKMEKWATDLLQAFDEFKAELREKLKEAQNDPSRLDNAAILKEILGE